MESMGGWRRLMFGFGNPGFQLTERIVVNVAIYFYLPPAGRGLVPQVSNEIYFGVFTAFGAAMLIGRFADALADPFVGYASDRSRSRWGRRRSFLMVGVIPMAALPALLFWPPGSPGSASNGIWLALILSLYFVFYTVYVAPYLSLIPELARDQTERVRLATWMAVLAFPVLSFYGVGWAWGFDVLRQSGYSSDQAIRTVVVASCGVAFLWCLLPILAVDERRFARAQVSTLSLREALTTTLRNRAFRIYLVAQIFFMFGINLVQPALVYYATVVLGRTEGFAAVLGGAMLVTTLLGFPLVGRAADRFGAKRSMVFCVGLFAVAIAALGGLRADVPGGASDFANLVLMGSVMAAVGPPIAGFLVLPHVLISQLIDADAARTGAQRAAMYFGVQGFLTKWVFGASGVVLAFLFARFGNSAEAPLGVMLVGPVAAVACGISVWLYARYPETEVLGEIHRSSQER